MATALAISPWTGQPLDIGEADPRVTAHLIGTSLVTSLGGPATTTSPPPEPQVTNSGEVGLRLNQAAWAKYPADQRWGGARDFSLLVRINKRGQLTNYDNLVSQGSYFASGGGWMIGDATGGATDHVHWCAIAAIYNQSQVSFGSLSNDAHTLGVIYDHAATTSRLYCDGAYVTSLVKSVGLPSNEGFWVGASQDGNALGTNVDVLCVASMSGTLLPESEMLDLTSGVGIYSLFLQQRTPVFYSLGPTAPLLSAAGMIDIGQTSARPQVTLTFA